MAIVEFEEGALRIDAAVIGQGLNVEPSLVQVRMREGKITVLCECGVDEDAGRYRVTFFHKNRRFRLVVDEGGNALQRPTELRHCLSRSDDSRFWRIASFRADSEAFGSNADIESLPSEICEYAPQQS
jgi:hypothetical protein